MNIKLIAIKLIKSILFFNLLLIVTSNTQTAKAQSCGVYSITRIISCGQDKTTGACTAVTQTTNGNACVWNGVQCMGKANSASCDSGCQVTNTFDVNIPCGTATGGAGGGSCPSECRKGPSCGTGYSGASGCGTCPMGSNGVRQVCCKANFCGNSLPSPSGPTNLQAVCSPTSNSVTLSWTAGANATAYHVNVNNTVNDTASCTNGWYCTDPPDKIYNNYPSTSFPMTITAGQTYSWWLQSVNASGTSSTVAGPAFNCNNCSITAPTITSINRDSATSATIKWTPGVSQTGSVQKIFISQSENQVNNDCTLTTTPGCVVNKTNLAGTVNSYATGSVLAAGSVYYVRIVNYASPTCTKNSNTTNSGGTALAYLSSCSLSPTSLTMQVGETGTITNIVNTNARISRVDFASTNTSAVTVTSPDSTSPYTSTATSVGPGTASITSSVIFSDGSIACTNVAGGNGTLSGGGDDGYPGSNGGGTTTPNASADTNGGGGGTNGNTSITSNALSDAWWQTVDSDLTSNGSLNSTIPAGQFFGLPGAGGTAGIPTYTTTTTLSPSTASTQGWITQNTNNSFPVFDYNYFSNQVPSDVVFNTIGSPSISGSTFASGGVSSYGYYWYKYDGSSSGLDLTINSAVDVGNRKVILLVKSASLNVNSTINIDDGLGFFMTVVDKNINIDPTVGGGVNPNLEGFFIADDTFDTGLGTNQLKVRGAVVAYNGITLSRDLGLGNSTTAGEQFEYAPDQSMLFPSKFAVRKISWKEVAP